MGLFLWGLFEILTKNALGTSKDIILSEITVSCICALDLTVFIITYNSSFVPSQSPSL